jgi:hypothetical protein
MNDQEIDPAVYWVVDRGIKLLDQRIPNWREKIDLTTLDLASSQWCVLGQVEGHSFYEGMRLLFEDSYIEATTNEQSRLAARYGFDVDGLVLDYDSLQEVWEERLS